MPCGMDPLTGFFRDGCCNTCERDIGSHTVCIEVTADFLQYSRFVGNDLSTPHPEFEFPGLMAGDHWCLCAGRRVPARLPPRALTTAPPEGREIASQRCTSCVTVMAWPRVPHFIMENQLKFARNAQIVLLLTQASGVPVRQRGEGMGSPCRSVALLECQWGAPYPRGRESHWPGCL